MLAIPQSPLEEGVCSVGVWSGGCGGRRNVESGDIALWWEGEGRGGGGIVGKGYSVEGEGASMILLTARVVHM